MRVTNNTLINNMMRHLNRGLSRLDRYQQQLASGKQVLKPSDDPAGESASWNCGLPSWRTISC